MQSTLFTDPGIEPAEPHPDLVRLGQRLPPTVYLGTSSWSFPGWNGWIWRRSYARERLSAEGLAAYAQHPLLRTVSIDRTYYRMPPFETLRSYAEAVPDDFRFIVKAPAACTAASTRGNANPYLLDRSWATDHVYGPLQEALGPKLGLILFQFPPQGAIPGFYDRLAQLLDPAVATAVEVRNADLLRGPLAAVLRDCQSSPCLTLHPTMPDLRTQWKALQAGMAPELVIRWNLSGRQGYEDAKARYAPFDRVIDADPAQRQALANGIDWALRHEKRVWIIANNKAEGCAPGTLEAIAERWARGLPDAGR